MSQELIYTSVPKGLKPGSRGFSTVAMTNGLSSSWVDRLESLSGYQAIYPLGDANADRNPISFCHWRVTVAGKARSVLSRIAFAGADYSQRSNKLAHHLVLESNEQAAGGPAWMMRQRGAMRSSWSSEPQLLPAGPELPSGDRPPAVCTAWAAVTGDAGWGGVLAESFINNPSKPAYVIFEPGMDVLALFEEAIALLSPKQRWEVSFNTYFTELPLNLTCAWRAVAAGTPAAKDGMKAAGRPLVIDLTQSILGAPADSILVTAARTGQRGGAAAKPVPASKVFAEIDRSVSPSTLDEPSSSGRNSVVGLKKRRLLVSNDLILEEPLDFDSALMDLPNEGVFDAIPIPPRHRSVGVIATVATVIFFISAIGYAIWRKDKPRTTPPPSLVDFDKTLNVPDPTALKKTPQDKILGNSSPATKLAATEAAHPTTQPQIVYIPPPTPIQREKALDDSQYLTPVPTNKPPTDIIKTLDRTVFASLPADGADFPKTQLAQLPNSTEEIELDFSAQQGRLPITDIPKNVTKVLLVWPNNEYDFSYTSADLKVGDAQSHVGLKLLRAKAWTFVTAIDELKTLSPERDLFVLGLANGSLYYKWLKEADDRQCSDLHSLLQFCAIWGLDEQNIAVKRWLPSREPRGWVWTDTATEGPTVLDSPFLQSAFKACPPKPELVSRPNGWIQAVNDAKPGFTFYKGKDVSFSLTIPTLSTSLVSNWSQKHQKLAEKRQQCAHTLEIASNGKVSDADCSDNDKLTQLKQLFTDRDSLKIKIANAPKNDDLKQKDSELDKKISSLMKEFSSQLKDAEDQLNAFEISPFELTFKLPNDVTMMRVKITPGDTSEK